MKIRLHLYCCLQWSSLQGTAALPFALLLALTGRWVWSLSGAAAIALFIYGMGELKFIYFYTRLIVADWSFVMEPANWTIVRQYPRIYTALAAFSTALLLLIIDASRPAADWLALVQGGRYWLDGQEVSQLSGDELARVFTRGGWTAFHPAARMVTPAPSSSPRS